MEWKEVKLPKYYKVLFADGEVRYYSSSESCDIYQFLRSLLKICFRSESAIVSVTKMKRCNLSQCFKID